MAVLLFSLTIAEILCDEINSRGVKREASIGGFRLFPSFDSLNIPQHQIAVGKTTVEYWPPDLDKKKFFSMKKESVIELWPKDMNKEMRVRINEPMIPSGPDALPDIPLNIKDQKAPEIYDYQALLRPTEASVIEEIAITNRSPIIFPTSEPTTRSPEREVAFVPRGSNKKRKLKKKVKPVPEVPFAETSEPFTPSTNSVIEVMPNGEQQKVQQATPIYEYIDEPVVNIFQPVRYTDVVSNLSNLTAQSFGMNNASNMIEIIDISPEPVGNSSSEQIKETLPINDASEITLSLNNELSPIDIMLNQLKSAIEERDFAKIRSIVQSMDEEPETSEKPKAEKKDQVTMMIEKTTEAITEKSSTSLPSLVTVSSADVATKAQSKVYLAPRVRAAQRKLKQAKTKSLSNKDKASTTVTEIPVMLTSKLKSTTEKMKTSTVQVTEPSNVKKGRQSHITPRVRRVPKTTLKSSRRS